MATVMQHKPIAEEQALSPEQAIERLLADTRAVTGTERVELRRSLFRTLAEQIVSPVNVPGHRNSAMDGYAIRYEDLASTPPKKLNVVGTAMAGEPYPRSLESGQSVRIMTGAVVPEGADTVIMQEQVVRDGDEIAINGEHRCGENVRHLGEDLKQGETVLYPGQWIGSAELGLLASLGCVEVTVRRQPRIAFFSTGDELKSLGQNLDAGEIYDSNRYTLYGMLTALGVDVLDMGVIEDQPEALDKAFTMAARSADMIITTGGVSVGEADYVKQVLDRVGQVGFWKIRMKPGRPLAYGTIGETAFFGLPGNPVSVMVCFRQFVQPVIKRMQGREQVLPVSVEVECRSTLKKRPGRAEFQRGILRSDESGELFVESTGSQGSGILRSMHEANCFILLEVDSNGVTPGDRVRVQPFESFDR